MEQRAKDQAAQEQPGEHRTTITFLGTSGAIPEAGGESPTFLINGRYLVDTGWTAVANLRNRGIEPLELEYVFFTHFHHDHYMALPSLLYYWLMRGKPLRELKIVGPAEDLELIVKRAVSFLHPERYYGKDDVPTLIPLLPGDGYEEAAFRLETCATVHPVQGLCYRFMDRRSGKTFTFTGDTAYHPPIAEHARGSALLVHESALGPVAADPANNAYMHAGAIDAGRIAEAAGVPKLLLVHALSSRAESCVAAAKVVFRGEVEWPADGQTYVL
ncbi:Metallo-beta-lactamase superfamily protein [Paenibacillus sp. UNC496MF]|uniref:MBL fold metallo-hydrolase n=1 Tax=Paenibacillus sp. UNC496MF TaxID=1502753 RepID=UPI0008F2E9F3|nr:MBL fold metallo-hydrolase [Paenibacillus sp. UNC496MF]SFJ80336.1 Metallo-beta-lactamase superfamily protein [Paenibacillus sp. UNC496MF]